MRKILLYSLVLFIFPPFFISAQSQPDRFAYAVTTVNKNDSGWVALRKLNTSTGVFSSILLNMRGKSLPRYSHSIQKLFANTATPILMNMTPGNNNSGQALNNSVAAIAYDSKGNRIFYVPMNTDELHYVDLSTMLTYEVKDQSFSKAGNYNFQTTSPITRLVIAPDNYGYTITNNENQLIRFTTSGTPVLTNLGELVDDPLNNEMGIHNPCANSGGDLVADDAGYLYLISASNRVFKIDTKNRVTSFLAIISGLPPQFTTNGAAVDENGNLLVSSSTYKDAYFIVNPKTWKVLPSPENHQIYGCADLANSNVLITKTTAPSIFLLNKSLGKTGKIRVFPNPVPNDKVSIQFDDLSPGNYTIQLVNVLGTTLIQQKAIITGRSHTELIYIPGYTAQGFYCIYILNEKNIVVSTQKLAIERW